MSKVSVYVENMFAGLPHTRQAAAQKAEAKQRLEARYAALLAEGKNEHEALGIVVAENDDLDDLRAKLGIRRGDAAKETLLAEYEAFTRRFAGGISAGVVLCLLAVAALIVLSGLMEPGSSLPGALFFVLAAAGVGIFVFYGIKNGHYLERLQAARLRAGAAHPAAAQAAVRPHQQRHHGGGGGGLRLDGGGGALAPGLGGAAHRRHPLRGGLADPGRRTRRQRGARKKMTAGVSPRENKKSSPAF